MYRKFNTNKIKVIISDPGDEIEPIESIEDLNLFGVALVES